MGYEAVELETIRQNIFATVYNLVNTYKPSGWTVLSAFPEDTVSQESDTLNFPFIVINPANVKMAIITMDGEGYIVDEITVEVEYYALAKSGKEKIDIARDNVQNTFLTNQFTLDIYNLLLKEDPFDDSNIDTTIIGKQIVNIGASIVSMDRK